MIFEHLSRASHYFHLHPGFQKACDYLGTLTSKTVPGRYELDGNKLFVNVQDYPTKPMESTFWEGHRQYIDIQMLLFGIEKIGFSPRERMTPQTYDEKKDLCVYQGSGDFFTLEPGFFVVFFPTDIHMPGLSAEASTTVRKVVAKVAMS